jgi:hypothetical protein
MMMKRVTVWTVCLMSVLFFASLNARADLAMTVVNLAASEDANPSQNTGVGRGTNAYSYMYPCGGTEGYAQPVNTNEWGYVTITQWDLSNPGSSSIISVTSATVQFMVSGDYSATGAYSGTYYFYRMTGAFDEESVTWDTKPAIDTSACVVWTPDATATNGSLVTLDVSSLLADNEDLTTLGLACIQIGGSGGSFLCQKEAGGSAIPSLNASYTVVPEPSSILMGWMGLMGLLSLRSNKK